jgi:hypothetical protein
MASSDVEKIANRFYKLGWLGVWIQAAMAVIPLAMLGYVLLGRTTSSGALFGILDYLALAGLLVLGFTTFWSYRYTRLAQRIADPASQPEWTSVAKTLRIGIWAGGIGIVVSMLLLVSEVLRVLFHFLKAPQGGVPVIRTEADSRAYWVSAIDLFSLLAEICTLIGELLIVAISLRLLFVVLKHIGVFGTVKETMPVES